jgi:hypothetical protein
MSITSSNKHLGEASTVRKESYQQLSLKKVKWQARKLKNNISCNGADIEY